MTTEFPIVTLWEITPRQAGTPDPSRTQFLTSSIPGEAFQLPYPNKRIWVGGQEYYCTAITVTGVERTVDVPPPARLRLELSDRLKPLQHGSDPLVQAGTRIRRSRLDVRGIDPESWASGVNPFTDQPRLLTYRFESWTVARVTGETFNVVEAEMETGDAQWDIPVRPALSNRCWHRYRGKNCGYTGDRYYNRQNEVVTERGQDVCALTVSACELRFPTGSLPFGGIPGVIREQQDQQEENT